jgi:hypothetical protein
MPAIAAACLAVIGVPVNTQEKLAALIVLALLLLSSAPREGARRYAAAAAIVLVAILVRAFVPHTQVEASHNLYLPTEDAPARYRDIPAEFRAALDAAFLRANPSEAWCDPGEELKRRGAAAKRPLATGETYYSIAHCWRNAVLRPDTFAFTGDGFFRAQPQVRVLDRLDINGLDDARIAALYAFDAAWYFWRENTNRIAPAWYLALTLPERLVGSRICTRGHVYWASDASWSEPQGGEACREVRREDAGSRLWAFEVGSGPRLAVRLERSAGLFAWDLTLRLVLVAALVAIVWLTLRVDPARFARLGLGTVAGGALVALVAPDFFTQALTVAAERDPLVYRGHGYDIAFALAEGRWRDALRGGEDVFLFMPGMRYFRAFELALFGDTSYATLIVLLATLPFHWRLANLVLEGRRAFAVAYMVLCLTIFARLFVWAVKGYGEAAGFFLLIAGVTVFLQTLMEQGRYGPAQAARLWAAFLLVALAAWIRPNFALVIGVMGLVTLRVHAAGFRWPTSLVILSASLLVFAVALHNAYFGGRLVWFTETLKGDSLRVDLGDYAAMLAEWLRGTHGEKSARIAHQLAGWMLPLRWLLLAATGYLLVRGGPGWRPARVLAGISLALYVPFLFYFSPSRHILTADAVGILCALAALRLGASTLRARTAAGEILNRHA